MEKLEEAATLPNGLTGDRPYSVPGIFLGTSAFAAKGWEGSFYPRGMQSRDYLVLRQMVNTKKVLKMFAFANNHIRRTWPRDGQTLHKFVRPTILREEQVLVSSSSTCSLGVRKRQSGDQTTNGRSPRESGISRSWHGEFPVV
jgi:hypothetical protein